MTNKQKLINQAREGGWCLAAIAEHLNVSLYTVHAWTKPATSASHREMPDWAFHALVALIEDNDQTIQRSDTLAITYHAP